MTRPARPDWAPGPAATSAEWWRQAVVYQIYPRGFAGSGADDTGGADDTAGADDASDLRGVISQIPYLAALGVDAIWLSPFDPSALAEFDEMTSGLQAHGIKVIADIAPNPISNQHPWFTEALAAPAGYLNLYRQALGWRRKLQAADYLEWMPGTSGCVLHFGRPGGWRSVTNFGPRAVPLPLGTVIVASAPLETGLLPAETTAWIIPGS